MSEKNILQMVIDDGASPKAEIPCQFNPEDRSIISGVAGKHQSGIDVSRLPDLLIGHTQNPQSPIDALRAHAAERDRIKPFEPISGTIPSALRRYDPSSENYWKDVHRTIDRWKHPSIFDTPIGGESPLKLPHAKPGYHFRVNPNTGAIEETRDCHTMDYRPERDGYNDGRPQYKLDPNTGLVVERSGMNTADWRSDRDGWQLRDHHYGLNPDTGKVELRPNVMTMKFRCE